MFQSVSGHSSKQSTAHYSLRPTVSQVKSVSGSDTISNWFENHQPQRTQIFTVTNAPFRSKLESNGLQIDRNRKFSGPIFSTPAIFKATSKRFGSMGCSVTKKNWLNATYPAFSLRFVDFEALFCFRWEFSFHAKRRSSQVWQRRNFPGPITILCYALQPMRLLHL